MSILLFDPTDTTRLALAGDFTVNKGTLAIEGVGFSTTGKLTYNSGSIEIDFPNQPGDDDDWVIFSETAS